MGHKGKNASNLEKMSQLEKVTLWETGQTEKKIGHTWKKEHIWKNGSYLKNESHFEKWVTFGKKCVQV